jgi:DNA (cytosine-5)-methyltransferase 1
LSLYRLIDLFSGAGGMTLGFHDAGFKSIQAVEVDEAAARTYEANFGSSVVARPIQEVDSFPEADVLIGGPPCQGFSPLGRNRDSRSKALLNRLWKEYVRALRQVRPAVFVIENVPEFVRSNQFKAFLATCRRDKFLAQYQVDYRLLNAADFGVPQRRRRGVVIASRAGSPRWPEPAHGTSLFSSAPYSTVRDAIGDLPLAPDGRNWHIGRNPTPKSLQRYKAVPEGGNRFDLALNRPDLLPDCWRRKKTGTTDVFGRLWWDKPALTIRTEFFKPEKGRYLHPEADRPITHREAARLQSFPDDFIFEGSKIEVAKQIGNAVPPTLAYHVAVAVLSLFETAAERPAVGL